MDYQKHYGLLCERAKDRQLDCYTENHHIIPRCLGGSDESQNMVALTPEEHYVAHQLLVKMYPKHKGLVWAAIKMTGHSKNDQRSNNKKYGWLRRLHSQNASIQLTEQWKDPEFRKNQTKISSRRLKELWEDPTFRKNTTLFASEKLKEMWADPEFRAQRVKCIRQAAKSKIGSKNSSFGKSWFYNPETGKSAMFFPEKVPEGFVKGRKIK